MLGTADDIHEAHQHDDAVRRPEPDLHARIPRTRCSCATTRSASTAICTRPGGCSTAPRPTATGMATWADVKANALKLGILLTDQDVGDVPLLATDAYGNFMPARNGFAQVVVTHARWHRTAHRRERATGIDLDIRDASGAGATVRSHRPRLPQRHGLHAPRRYSMLAASAPTPTPWPEPIAPTRRAARLRRRAARRALHRRRRPRQREHRPDRRPRNLPRRAQPPDRADQGR